MINKYNDHAIIIQTLTAGGGTLLTGAAVITAVVPAIYAITAYILPLILASGAVTAWIALTAETIAGCVIKPTPALLRPPSPHLSEVEDFREVVDSRPSPSVSPPPVPQEKRKEESPVPSSSPSPSHSEAEESERASRPVSPPLSNENRREAVETCEALIESCLTAAQEKHSKEVVQQLNTRLQLTRLSIKELIATATDETLSLITQRLEEEIQEINEALEGVAQADNAEKYKDYEIITTILEVLASNKREWSAEKDEKLKAALEKIYNIDRLIPPLGDTLFIRIATHGAPLEAIPILSERGADFNAHETIYGNTALFWAVANAHNSMAMKIIEAGKKRVSEPPNWDETDREGKTALILALAKGYRDRNSDGRPLLFSNYQIAEALLVAGASANVAFGGGMTALHVAALRRDVEMVKLLLNHEGDRKALYQHKGSSHCPIDLLSLPYGDARQITKNIARVFSFPSEAEFNAATAKIQGLLS